MPMQTLTLSRANLSVLQDLADNASYARAARRDTLLARTYSEVRYYIMGAFKVDIQDDKEIRSVLTKVENNAVIIDVKYDFEHTDLD